MDILDNEQAIEIGSNILNNEWVIGIGAGIISGLLVFVITRYFFQAKDSKEYFQKVAAANREVLYAIRPGIAEGEVPNSAILKHLIIATARKYGIKQNAMLTVNEIASELTKEVMDSAFISTATKLTFCQKLSFLSEDDKTASRLSDIKIEHAASQKYQTFLSASLSLIAMLATTLLVAFSVQYSLFQYGDNYSELLLTVFGLLFIALSTTLTFYIWIRFNKQKRLQSRIEEDYKKIDRDEQ